MNRLIESIKDAPHDALIVAGEAERPPTCCKPSIPDTADR